MDTMLRLALRKYNRLRQQVDNMLLGDEGDVVETELRKFVAKRPCWNGKTVQAPAPQPKPGILRCISVGEQIVIGATTGAKTITSATDVFTWGIDPDFKNWGLDVPGEAKPETPVQVSEMVRDGDYRTIYGSIGQDLNTLRFTQEQIIAFVRDHKKWLRTGGYATFFLFKVENEFFVANVGSNDDGRPDASVLRFSSGRVWDAGIRHRIVLPQLTLEP
jgi:hypothetical protein